MKKHRILTFVIALIILFSSLISTAYSNTAVTSAWHTFDGGDYVPSTEEQIANGTAHVYAMSDGGKMVLTRERRHYLCRLYCENS